MNKEFAIKWIAALRSGEYKQTIGMLESLDGRNCCLGVACRVLGIRPSIISATVLFDGSASYLPTKNAIDLGVTRTIQLSFTDRKGYSLSLSQLNDGGFTFDQIADVIEYEAGV